jgi:signal transduction histidine kinase/PAS domain-containing protein
MTTASSPTGSTNKVPAPNPPDHHSEERSHVSASHAVTVLVPPEGSLPFRYGVGVVAPIISLLATLPIESVLQRAIFVLFWPAVIGTAWFGGIGPAILASALSVLLADYAIIEPRGALNPASPDDLIPLAVFLFASIAVALITTTARVAQRSATEAAARNAELAQELELQAVELEQQLEESQSLSEELEESSEELVERTVAAETAEQFTKGILESISHPFVVHDADWRFLFVNKPAVEALRPSLREPNKPLVGQVLWDAYPDIVGTDFEREMRRAATERRPVTFEAFYPATGNWSQLTSFPLPNNGLATQWIDITDQRRAQEREQTLARASEILGSSLDYETTLEQLARVVVPQVADWCAVHVVEEDGETRQLAVAHVDPAKVAWAHELNERYPPREDAPTGVANVLRTGQAEIYPEVTDEMLVAAAVDAEHLRISRELGLKSAMIVPLSTGGGRILGALTLVSAESGRRYSELDLPLATEMARRAAIAVEHARLHRQAVTARAGAERAARVADRLYALTARLTGASTPKAMAEAVLGEVTIAFGAQRGTVSLIEEDGDTTRLLSSFGYDPEVLRAWRSYSLRTTVAATRDAVTTGRGVFIESLDDARARYPQAASALEAVGTETAAVLPVLNDGRVRALITMAWKSRRPLPNDDRDFMELFAAQCGQALARALAFDAERVARERTERLQRVTAALAGASSASEVARVLVSNLQDVLEPRRVAFYHVVRDDDATTQLMLIEHGGLTTSELQRVAQFPLSGDSPIATVARTGDALFLSNRAAFRARFPDWPAEIRSPDTDAWVGLALTASTGAALGAVAFGFVGDRDFDADMRRYVGAIVDLAAQALERVRLLQTEHSAREAAEEANRAKTQFLATMSHELRTPLNAISGYAELLSLGLRGPTTPEQQEDLGRIMRSQRHLLSVINDILNFARLEAGHVEYRVTNVPVAELVSDLEPLIRPQVVAKQLDFSCASVTSDVMVRADAEKVRQVLLNLLANAVKFTPQGGYVRVSCELDATRAYIRVTDSGIGIPLDRRSAIFEPFVQLHRTLAQPAEGTGLGLAISRDLARGMGGELTVESEPGQGSTFTLALDLVSGSWSA